MTRFALAAFATALLASPAFAVVTTNSQGQIVPPADSTTNTPSDPGLGGSPSDAVRESTNPADPREAVVKGQDVPPTDAAPLGGELNRNTAPKTPFPSRTRSGE